MPNPTEASSARIRTGLHRTLPMMSPQSHVMSVAAAMTQTSGRFTGS